jgi:2-oxoglutarate dehydrogenase E1 component
VFTSGRLYYDLEKHKIENGLTNIAVVRIEQLYPVPAEKINKILKKYKKATSLVWAQDEPENMGAWPFIQQKLGHLGFIPTTRKESASPAVGLMEKHKQGLNEILEVAFKIKVPVES